MKLVQMAMWCSANSSIRMNFIYIRCEVNFPLKRGSFEMGLQIGANFKFSSVMWRELFGTVKREAKVDKICAVQCKRWS